MWTETDTMATEANKVERHHWLNTFIGILDAAFHLTEIEQAQLIAIFRDLLVAVRVPERGEPEELPAALALEVTSNFFTISLAGPRDSGVARPVRAVMQGDVVVSLEAWRTALVGMLTVAYPDMLPAERLLVDRVFTDVLSGIGVPQRAAEFLPGDVVRTYRSMPEFRTW
jgi:hypothetical protein